MPRYLRQLWVTGPPDEVERVLPRHLAELRDLRERGKLLTAGRIGRDDGFVELLEAADRREADALLRDNPLVEAGLVSGSIRPWSDIDLD